MVQEYIFVERVNVHRADKDIVIGFSGQSPGGKPQETADLYLDRTTLAHLKGVLDEYLTDLAFCSLMDKTEITTSNHPRLRRDP